MGIPTCSRYLLASDADTRWYECLYVLGVFSSYSILSIDKYAGSVHCVFVPFSFLG